MLSLTYTIVILGFILIPLLTSAKKKMKKPVYTIDRDTSNAQYVINEKGELEKISETPLSGRTRIKPD